MRKIHLIIGLSIIVFSSCSQKISKLDFDKQAYEYQQLQLRYELLKKEQSGNTGKGITEVTNTTIPVVNNTQTKELTDLQAKYEALLEEKLDLERAYNATVEQTKEIENLQNSIPPGSVPVTNYNELKTEKAQLEKKYVILEKRYAALKESKTTSTSTISSAEYADATIVGSGVNTSKGVYEESSLRTNAQVITRASYNGLYFEYDTYNRNNNYLILDIAVKNNNQSNLKTVWETGKIQITDSENRTIIANSFRVGVDYVDTNRGILTKRIKDENTVFARFAFENVPNDFNLITSLKFTVIIDGEERNVELAQLDIVEVQ